MPAVERPPELIEIELDCAENQEPPIDTLPPCTMTDEFINEVVDCPVAITFPPVTCISDDCARFSCESSEIDTDPPLTSNADCSVI